MVDNIFTLLMLILLQAVLGFDNLLYISLESQRVPKEKQKTARSVGIGLAIVLRLALLFLLYFLMEKLQKPVLNFPEGGFVEGHFSIHSIIVLLGGAFIIYTAIKEILHMLNLEEEAQAEKKPKSLQSAITMIVIMNLVFSFDSILSAIALTKVLWVMATAIVIGGVLMIVFSGKVSEFLQKNRMYEVLGLFILFVVGIMLLSEGGHLAHMKLFGQEITAMSKSTFYFVVVVLVIVDIVQSRYQRKLQRQKQQRQNK